MHIIKHLTRISFLLVLIFFAASCSILKKESNNGEFLSKKEVKNEQKYLEYKNAFYEGEKQKMLGNYNEAVSYFLKCLSLSPNKPTPAYEIANIAVINKDIESAAKFAQQAYNENPKNKWFIITLADIKKRQGDLKTTLKLIDELINIAPNEKNYYLEKANTLLLMNKPDETIKVYKQIDNKFGISEETLYQEYTMFANRNDFLNARKTLKKLIKLNPDETTYYRLLANSYMQTGQMKEAKEIYDKLYKISPNDGVTFLSLADYYRVNGNNDSMIYFVKKSFESDDLNLENKLDILYKFFSQKQNNNDYSKDTYELINILKNKYPNNPDVYGAAYDFMIDIKNYEKAWLNIIKIVYLSPANGKAWEQLMLLDNKLKQNDSLYIHSKKAMELFPNNVNFYWNNAIASRALKRYAEAAKVLKTGLNYVVDDNKMLIAIYSLLGDTYQELKNYTESEKYYEKVLELDPDNDYVLNNYSYFLSLRKSKLEKAEQMAKKNYENHKYNYNYADTYGWVLFQSGKYKEAENILKFSVENGGDKSAVILEHYGDALYKNNKKAEAVEIWKLAKEKSSNPSLLENKIKNGLK